MVFNSTSLSEVVDQLDIPVLCYGLRTDFRGELFIGIHQPVRNELPAVHVPHESHQIMMNFG